MYCTPMSFRHIAGGLQKKSLSKGWKYWQTKKHLFPNRNISCEGTPRFKFFLETRLTFPFLIQHVMNVIFTPYLVWRLCSRCENFRWKEKLFYFYLVLQLKLLNPHIHTLTKKYTVHSVELQPFGGCTVAPQLLINLETSSVHSDIYLGQGSSLTILILLILCFVRS